MRQTVVDWWTQVMQTRLNSAITGAYVIVMQRLHVGDLTGHVLANETGWTHLCLPARYEPDHPCVWARDPRTEPNEIIWPENMPAEKLDERERTMGAYTVAGQHQQRPAPREGGLFRREWLPIVKAAPAGGTIGRGWDLAGTTKKKSPWTAGVLMKRVKNEYYICDVIRRRGTPGDVEKMIVTTTGQDVSEHGPGTFVDFPQDPGQAGKFQRKHFTGQLAGFTVHASTESGSKATRAEPLSGQAQANNVFLVEGTWNGALIEEFELFPNSDFSDQVDAASRVFARLASRPQRGYGTPGLLITS